MKVHVTRDSVAMGDDIDAPHEKGFKFPDNTTIEDMVTKISSSGYLAKIQGGNATWSVVSGIPISVVAQQWSEPRFIDWQPIDISRLKHSNNMVLLHFNYHAQTDPSIVLDVLQRAKLHAL